MNTSRKATATDFDLEKMTNNVTLCHMKCQEKGDNLMEVEPDSSTMCIVWVNLNYPKWGDGQLHITPIPDFLPSIQGVLNDNFPPEVLDGYLNIKDSDAGRSNFAQIRDLLSQQTDPVGIIEKMFCDASSQDGLMIHPLLKLDQSSTLLGAELIQNLQEVKCFVVNENFDEASKNLQTYGTRMRDLI